MVGTPKYGEGNMGTMYTDGKGVEQDFQKAFALYEEARRGREGCNWPPGFE